MHSSSFGGPIPTTAGEGGMVRAHHARRAPRREVIDELRRRTLAGAAAALPSAHLEPASEPDRLGFG